MLKMGAHILAYPPSLRRAPGGNYDCQFSISFRVMLVLKGCFQHCLSDAIFVGQIEVTQQHVTLIKRPSIGNGDHQSRDC